MLIRNYGSSQLWCAIALLLVNFIIFGQSLGFGFIPYDDPAYVTGNGYVNQGLSLEGLRWAFWYGSGGQSLQHVGVANLWHPFTWLSHMLDVSFFGLEGAWGHHFVNLLLHGIASVLLMFVAFRMFQSAPAAFVVALLWMIHPLKAESVAWISERKDLLSGAFFWGSLACVIQGQGVDCHESRWRTAGWMLFVCALLSKPSVVILPALLIVLEVFIRDDQSLGWAYWKSAILRYKWWFATSLVVSIITVSMQSQGSHAYFMAQSSLGQRMIPQALAMGFYLWRLIVPWNLSVDYATPDLPLAVHLVFWLLLIAALGVVFWLRKKSPRLFFAVAWWGLCLLPVSGLFHVGTSFTSDRYLYLALAGPLLALVPFFKEHLESGKKTVPVAILGVAVIWGGLSRAQTAVWKDGWTLFEHAIKAQPRSSLGWSNLGSLHQRSGNFLAARPCFEQAVSLEASDYIAWFNLGRTFKDLGDEASAITAYRTSLQWYPQYIPAQKNLAIILMENGQIQEAGKLLQQSCEASGFQDPIILWLYCESELAQGNYQSAAKLLDRLDAMTAQSDAISKGIRRARAFLKSSSP